MRGSRTVLREARGEIPRAYSPRGDDNNGVEGEGGSSTKFVMSKLGLTLHPEKTRMVDLRRGKESFVFLGCTIRKKRKIQRQSRAYYMQRWPSPKR